MRIMDGSSLFNYNNLYTTKKAAKGNQFDTNMVSNVSQNNTSSSASNITLYKDAVISSHSASGASTHVFHGEEDGTYTVKGTDTDGKEYETTVNIKDVNPNNASRIEMTALAAYLQNRDAESFLLTSRREMDAYFSLSPTEQNSFKWNSLFAKENQYDDLNYIAQNFYKAGALDGYAMVNKLIQNIRHTVNSF